MNEEFLHLSKCSLNDTPINLYALDAYAQVILLYATAF